MLPLAVQPKPFSPVQPAALPFHTLALVAFEWRARPGSPAGSDAKHSAFLSRFGDAEQLGPGDAAADGAQLASSSGRAEMHVTPWLLKTGLSPQQAATQDENWCGVLQVSPGCVCVSLSLSLSLCGVSCSA